MIWYFLGSKASDANVAIIANFVNLRKPQPTLKKDVEWRCDYKRFSIFGWVLFLYFQPTEHFNSVRCGSSNILSRDLLFNCSEVRIESNIGPLEPCRTQFLFLQLSLLNPSFTCLLYCLFVTSSPLIFPIQF